MKDAPTGITTYVTRLQAWIDALPEDLSPVDIAKSVQEKNIRTEWKKSVLNKGSILYWTAHEWTFHIHHGRAWATRSGHKNAYPKKQGKAA